MPPAQAAAEAGFADQAHLTRHFKRIVGVPPGAYQRSRTGVAGPARPGVAGPARPGIRAGRDVGAGRPSGRAAHARGFAGPGGS